MELALSNTGIILRQTYMTVKEAAERLRVHPETIRRLVRSDELRAIKIGRIIRISVAAIEDYERKNTTID